MQLTLCLSDFHFTVRILALILTSSLSCLIYKNLIKTIYHQALKLQPRVSYPFKEKKDGKLKLQNDGFLLIIFFYLSKTNKINSTFLLTVKENITFYLNSLFSGYRTGPSIRIRETPASQSINQPCELPSILSTSYKNPSWGCVLLSHRWCNALCYCFHCFTDINEQNVCDVRRRVEKVSDKEILKTRRPLFETFSRNVFSAGLPLWMCWRGASRSTICWSVKVSALMDFFFLLLSLFWNSLSPPPCSSSTLLSPLVHLE